MSFVFQFPSILMTKQILNMMHDVMFKLDSFLSAWAARESRHLDLTHAESEIRGSRDTDMSHLCGS